MAVIDSLEFARTGQALSGSLPIAGLARLKDSLHETAGEVRFEVKGGRDARRRLVLMLVIRGALRLQCQRCLGALDFPLQLANTLLLAAGDASEFEDDDADWIEPSPALDVVALVEDEILLSLPYAPRHEESRCAMGGGSVQREGGRGGAFAQLATLKRDDH